MKKKYVLITGSSRGIGRACAVAFAKNGYHVFINCKNSVEQLAETEHEILASGGGCTALPGDVSGKIINISSMWGTAGASCEAAYSASKSGLHGLTKALAKELAPSGISVNAVACGVIDTDMNSRLNEEEKNMLCEEIPAGRFGTCEEVARTVLALAESPAYLTAQIIGIDGGFL